MLERYDTPGTNMDRHGVRSKLPRGLIAMTIASVVMFAIGLINLPLGLDGPISLVVADDKPVSERESTSSTPGEHPAEDERKPFSLAYVPRDTKLFAAIRPSVLKRSPSFKALNDVLTKGQRLERLIGVSADQIEQVVFVIFDDKSESVAIIFHLVRPEAVASILDAMLPHREEQDYANQKYFRRQTKDGTPTCIFADGSTVVVAPNEKHLRRLIVAGSRGATHTKWAQELQNVIRSDMLALVNIGKLLSQYVVDGGQMSLVRMFSGLPPDLAPLMDVSTAVVCVEVAEIVHGKLWLKAKNDAVDIPKLDAATRRVFDLFQAVLTMFRVDASGKDDDEGVDQLRLIDAIDEFVDRIEVLTDSDTVAASVQVEQSDIAKIVESIASLIDREWK